MSHRRAFALLPLLTLSALCLAVALMCLGAARLGSVSASSGLRRARCSLAALAAARLGCAEIAQALGPDGRWSGLGADGATWSARRQERGEWISAPLSGVADDFTGVRMAWSGRDLSCGVDLAAPILAQERSALISRKPRMRQRLASGATQPPASIPLMSAARVCDLEGLRGMTAPDSTGKIWVAGARSLLVDPSAARWRENLSEPSALAKRLGPALSAALLSRPTELRDAPSRGLEPLELGDGQVRLRHMPVLVDLALSLGVFNARSDGRHRARFHAQMTLWNPSALPMLTYADKRLFLAEIEGAPEITVTNLDSGASFTTWLDRCAPGTYWGYTQGVRERSLWWWVEVLDVTRQGMARSGLLPGEVYSLLMPDPQAQPYGFSRVIGRETWRLDDAEHPPGWVRPSPEVFLPSDRIRIAVRFISPGTTLRLHPYVGSLDAATEAAAYPSPSLLTLAHVPWPDGRIEITGAEYSRPDSNGYVIAERRFCWRMRLAAATEADVLSVGNSPALMGRLVDLAEPACRASWTLTDDPIAEAQQGPATFGRDPSGVLDDLEINRHDALVDRAFADWRLRDVPVDPPLDVLSLRLLQGAPYSGWLADLDKAFFSCPAAGTAEPTSENPRLCPWAPPRDPAARAALSDAIAGPAAAESLALEGAFNVNNADPSAWEAFLASDPLRWSADAGGPAPAGRIEAPIAFFSQPTGAMLAKYADSGRCDLQDEALAGLGAEANSRAARRQSVRSPAPVALRRFCERLCDEISQRGTPFTGLGDFLGSGVVDRAIASSRLNEGILPLSPMCLDAPTIFGSHAALMVARGDTFAVRGEARCGHDVMTLELKIQRVPALASMPHLGRRFVVTQARWIEPASP